MFARFSKLVVGLIFAVLVISGCSLFGQDSGQGGDVYTIAAADVADDQCIVLKDEPEQYYPDPEIWRQGDEIVSYSETEVVDMTGEYVGRSPGVLLCLTAEEVEYEQRKALYEEGKACYGPGYVLTSYEGSEYVGRDRHGRCLTQAEVDQDNQAADNLIAQLDTIDSSLPWTERAAQTVELYCASPQPVMAENVQKVTAAYETAYTAGRQYAPGYQREFADAVQEWCGGYPVSSPPASHADMMPLPPPPVVTEPKGN